MSAGITGRWPRGSEWRKWDLHVHSPASEGFKGDYNQFIIQLGNADCDVIGINDYFSVDGYKEVMRRLDELHRRAQGGWRSVWAVPDSSPTQRPDRGALGSEITLRSATHPDAGSECQRGLSRRGCGPLILKAVRYQVAPDGLQSDQAYATAGYCGT